jgi:hypothetical protein
LAVGQFIMHKNVTFTLLMKDFTGLLCIVVARCKVLMNDHIRTADARQI